VKLACLSACSLYFWICDLLFRFYRIRNFGAGRSPRRISDWTLSVGRLALMSSSQISLLPSWFDSSRSRSVSIETRRCPRFDSCAPAHIDLSVCPSMSLAPRGSILAPTLVALPSISEIPFLNSWFPDYSLLIPFILNPIAPNCSASNFVCSVVSLPSGGRTLAHSGSFA
jgi:hypothetical protein